MQVVTFILREHEYAFPIEVVKEIVEMPRAEPLPDAPPFFEGVQSLRGEVLPIINLRLRIGLPAAEETEDGKRKVLVAQSGGVKCGFVVDDIRQVKHLEAELIQAPPLILETVGDKYIDKVAKEKSEDGTASYLVILSLDGILDFEIGDRRAAVGA